MKKTWDWLRLTDDNVVADIFIWLILLMPLILYIYVYQPFSFGRYFIFMFLVAGLVFGLLLSKSIKSYYRWWREPTFWLACAWLAIALLSASIGVNPFRSWWGTISRSTGMFFFTSIWLMSGVLLMLVNRKENWLKIFSIISWVGSISGLFAILQRLKIPLVYIVIGSDRVSALMGNPIFFAQLLLFTIFLTLYFWWSSSGKIKWFYLFGLLLQLVAIVLTASRGPLLAMVIAGLVWLVGWWRISRPLFKLDWRIWVGSGAGVVLLTSIVYFLLPKSSLDRLSNVFNETVTARIITWQTAWEAIRARPILGYGNENAWYAFTHFYQPGLADISFGETIVDRAHNLILDQLLVNGWIGLIVALALLSYLAWSLWKYIKKSIQHNNLTEAMLGWSLLALALAYFLAEMTVFDNLTGIIYGAILLTGIVVILSDNLVGPVRLEPIWIWRSIALMILIGLLFFNFRYLIPAFKIGQSVGLADNAAKHNNYPVAAKAYAKAQETITPYRWSFMTNYPNFARAYSMLLLSEKKMSWADSMAVDGLRVLKNIEKQEPDRVAILMERPLLYLVMSYSNKDYTAKANESFNTLIKEFPNHEYIYLNWAKALSGVGKYTEARQVLDKLSGQIKVLPKEFEFWRAVTDIQLKSLDKKHIINDLQTSVKRKVNLGRGYQDVLQIIVGYLVELDQWELAKYYQENIVVLLPDSADEHINLSAIYKELGQFDKAAEQARRVVKLDPSKTDVTKQFLQSIGQTL